METSKLGLTIPLTLHQRMRRTVVKGELTPAFVVMMNSFLDAVDVDPLLPNKLKHGTKEVKFE